MRTPPLGQAVASVDRARQLFNRAQEYYQRRSYRKAIILYERARQLAGTPDSAKRACLYNIGMANLKLRRFATAIIYFETFLQSPGITEKDRADAQRRLSEAKRGAGVQL